MNNTTMNTMKTLLTLLLFAALCPAPSHAADQRPSPPPPTPKALNGAGLAVLAIGDSNTEIGNWVQPLADDLSKVSGYCGSGYRGFGGNKPDNVVGNARHPELQPYLVLSVSGAYPDLLCLYTALPRPALRIGSRERRRERETIRKSAPE